jgi:hypothetical protein
VEAPTPSVYDRGTSRLAYADLEMRNLVKMAYDDAADAAFAKGRRLLDEAGHDERQREPNL